MPRRQRHELVALAGEERIRTYNERADMRLVEGSESGIDLAFGAGVSGSERLHLSPHVPGRRSGPQVGRPYG